MSVRFAALVATLRQFLSVDGRIAAFWTELGEFGDDNFDFDILDCDRL